MKKLLFLLLLVVSLVSCVEKETTCAVANKVYHKPYTTTHFIKVGHVHTPRKHYHAERYELVLYSPTCNHVFHRDVSKTQFDKFNIGDSVIIKFKTFR